MPIFDEIDRLFKRWQKFFEEMERELEEEFRAFTESAPRISFRRPGVYYYGFEITIGPDGKPVVREFGNVRPREGKPVVSEEIEPLTDVIEDEDKVRVVVEMPGVDKENISVTVSDDGKKLYVSARSGDRKYYKEIDLPAPVDPKKAKATYKNGVLSVELEKREKSRPGGGRIEVE